MWTLCCQAYSSESFSNVKLNTSMESDAQKQNLNINFKKCILASSKSPTSTVQLPMCSPPVFHFFIIWVKPSLKKTNKKFQSSNQLIMHSTNELEMDKNK